MRNALLVAIAVSVLSSCLLAQDAVAGPNPATASRPGVSPRARPERSVLIGHVAAADVGGGRYDKFVKTCEQRYKHALANAEENTRKLQEADEQLFNLRVLEHAFKNPNFVATPHTH